MKFKKILILLMGSAFMMLTMAGLAAAAWPERPITLVIMHAAGGGTDMIHRALAPKMEKSLGATINCVNRTGGGGGLAAEYVFSNPSDGYFWMGAAQFGKPLRVMGYSNRSPWKDWLYFKSLGGHTGWTVRADSPFKTLADMLEAGRKNPGKIRVGTGGPGTIPDEGLELLRKETGVKFNSVPYSGDATSALACLQGEIEVSGGTVAAHVEFVRAGKMRFIAMINDKPIKMKDGITISPVTDLVPGMSKYLPFENSYAIAVKRDTPVEILEKIKKAFIDAVNSPELDALAEKRHFFKAIAIGEEADRLAAKDESLTAWLLWDQKAEGVKFNPADLGIPRPENFDASWPPKDYKPRISSK